MKKTKIGEEGNGDEKLEQSKTSKKIWEEVYL